MIELEDISKSFAGLLEPHQGEPGKKNTACKIDSQDPPIQWLVPEQDLAALLDHHGDRI